MPDLPPTRESAVPGAVPPGGSERRVADRYRLVTLLGGGSTHIWAAEDELLGRRVAVQEVIFPSRLAAAERTALSDKVVGGIRAAARLRTTGLVTIYDVLTDGPRPLVVMELVDGRSLTDEVRDAGPLPAARAAQLGYWLSVPLSAAHRTGLVHGAVSPADVLVGPAGRVRLTGFGLAALPVARDGRFVAPELAAGDDPSPASDVWGVGATVFYAVEGGAPFTGEDGASGPRRPFLRAGPLAGLLGDLLAADPADRPSLRDVRDRLRAFLPDTTTPAPTPAGGRRGRARAALPAAAIHPALPAGTSTSADATPVAGGTPRGRAEPAGASDAVAPQGAGGTRRGDAEPAGAAGRAAPTGAGTTADLPTAAAGTTPDLPTAGPGKQTSADGTVEPAKTVTQPAVPAAPRVDLAKTPRHPAATELTAPIPPVVLAKRANAAQTTNPIPAVRLDKTADTQAFATPAAARPPIDLGPVKPAWGAAGRNSTPGWQSRQPAATRRDLPAQPAPAPAPAPTPSPAAGKPPGRRTRLLLLAGLLIAVAALAVVLVLATSGGGSSAGVAVPTVAATAVGATATSSPAATSASPTPKPTPSRTAAKPTRPATAVPVGWTTYRDARGWSIGHPPDWRVRPSGGVGGVDFVEPLTGSYLHIDTLDKADPSALADWQRSESSFRAEHPGYRRIRLAASDGGSGATQADWEFTYRQGSLTLHVLNRGMVRNGHGYALYWQTPDSTWAGEQALMRQLFATFRPAP